MLGLNGTQSEASQVSVPMSQGKLFTFNLLIVSIVIQSFVGMNAAASTGGKLNYKKADNEFRKKFTENELGAVCNVCERIWFQNDLKPITTDGARVLLQPGHFESVAGFMGCQTCRQSLKDGKVPVLSTTNGFTYPEIPPHLPLLDIITERLISARLPFMQIRRLCHARGSV